MRGFFSGQKKSTKINFSGLETSRWGGGLPREGVVADKFVPSLESLSSLGFEERRGIWDVPGILPGCPAPLGVFKKFVQKKKLSFVHLGRLPNPSLIPKLLKAKYPPPSKSVLSAQKVGCCLPHFPVSNRFVRIRLA